MNGENIDSVFTQRNFTKITHLEKIIGKVPRWALSLFIVPSRDVHSLFWVPFVLRWHGMWRSYHCHVTWELPT